MDVVNSLTVHDVALPVLKAVAPQVARRIGKAAVNAKMGRRRRQDVSTAAELDAIGVVDEALNREFSAPEGVLLEDYRDWAASIAVEGFVHELLVLRITQAPEGSTLRVLQGLLSSAQSRFGVTAPLAAAVEDYFVALDHLCTRIADSTAKAEATMVDRITSKASATLLQETVAAIERHVAGLATAASLTWDQRLHLLETYRMQVIRDHGNIVPPDFDRRRKVPIEDLYESPSLLETSAEGVSESDIWKLADELDRSVLLGDPGGGKSTASAAIVTREARNAAGRVPFMVVLREFAGSEFGSTSIADYLERRLRDHYQIAFPEGLVTELLLNGEALVVFDGLDELLDTSRRREVTDVVELFVARFPLVPVLVTSRKVGYEQAPLDDKLFTAYAINGFDATRVENYVRRWFRLSEDLNEAECGSWTQSFMQESATVPDLRSNPLMLSLICIIYRGEQSIPRNRPDVYQKCATLLFERWDGHRNIKVSLRASHLIEPALRHLAFWLFTTASVTEGAVTEEQLVSETAALFGTLGIEDPHEAQAAAKEFVKFTTGRAWVFSDTGTTALGLTLYRFTHQTFLEYFCAAYIASTCDTPLDLARLLLTHVSRQEWDVVGQLAVAIKSRTVQQGGDRAILALLNDKRRRAAASAMNIAAFAGRCLTFLDAHPDTVRVVTRELVSRSLIMRAAGQDISEAIAPLFAASHVNRPVVAQELRVLTRSLANSTNAIDVRHAFTFSVWASVTPIGGDDSQEFWSKYAAEMTDELKNQIIAASGDKNPVTFIALMKGWISLTDYLCDRDEGLGPLLESWGDTAHRWRYVPYGNYLIRATFSDSELPADIRHKQWRELRQYIDTLDAPPFGSVDVSDPMARPYVSFEPEAVSAEVVAAAAQDPYTFDAVVVVLLSLVEVMAHEASLDVFEKTVLRDVAVALRQRRSGVVEVETDLLVSGRLAEMIQRWERGELSFVDIGQGED